MRLPVWSRLQPGQNLSLSWLWARSRQFKCQTVLTHSPKQAQTAPLCFLMYSLNMKTEQRHPQDLPDLLTQPRHLKIYLWSLGPLQLKKHHQTWRSTYKQWISRRRQLELSVLCTEQVDRLLISAARQTSTRLAALAAHNPNLLPTIQLLAKTFGPCLKGVQSATRITVSIHICMQLWTVTFFAGADTQPQTRL